MKRRPPQSATKEPRFPLDERSLLVALVVGLWRVIGWFNLYFWITRLSAGARRSRLFLEFYLVAWTTLILVILFRNEPRLTHYGAWLAGYRIVMLLHSRGTIFVEGGVRVRNVRAAILTVLLNVFEIINCFALLILSNGNQWEPTIQDPVLAIYVSTVSFLTLGYGDVHPLATASTAQLIVIAELWCFLFFVVVLGPLVFALASPHYRAEEPTSANQFR